MAKKKKRRQNPLTEDQMKQVRKLASNITPEQRRGVMLINYFLQLQVHNG